MIEVAFLGSGSSGNCAVVRSGRTAVLIDAGLSVRETSRRLKALGASLCDIQAVFVTHEHQDHARSAADFALKRGLRVYATEGTARAARLPGPLFADIRTVRGGDEVAVSGELTLRVTATPHDGHESVCYVAADSGGRRVGIATDLGHVSRKVLEALADCDVLGLEANHDVDLLRSGPYPAMLKRRILSDVGHLSNDAAAAALYGLVGPRTRAVAVLHVSKQNNTPGLAARTLRETLHEMGVVLPCVIAPPDRPTAWLGPASLGTAFSDACDGDGRGERPACEMRTCP